MKKEKTYPGLIKKGFLEEEDEDVNSELEEALKKRRENLTYKKLGLKIED